MTYRAFQRKNTTAKEEGEGRETKKKRGRGKGGKRGKKVEKRSFKIRKPLKYWDRGVPEALRKVGKEGRKERRGKSQESGRPA